MAYVVPIHRPSSVRHALKLNFLHPEEECLVVAKANRLEFFSQTPDGTLALEHSKAVYGKVTMLQKLRPASSSTDHLFVGTDRYMYFTVSWDATNRQLETRKSYQDAAEKMARDSQTGDRCHIDPSGRFMTLEIYEGIVSIIPLISKGKKKDEGAGDLGRLLLSRIEELHVRSSCFLQRQSDNPKMAFLHVDNKDNAQLVIRQLKYMPGGGSDEGEADMYVQQDQVPRDELDSTANFVIPVADPAYGLLILGETRITYYDDKANELLHYPLDEATIWVAWAQIDSQRFVLADEYGRLYLLMLVLGTDNVVTRWQLDELGETSRANVLVYLDAGLIFLGSHQGDSQVIRIVEGGIEVVQTFSNIAPILDFTIMDMGNRSGEGQSNEYSSGQARIVTGSGAFKDGSLRSVRSGVGLEELGVLGEMEHITDIFGLKSNASSDFMDTLVVTFVNETRIFRFNADGEVDEADSFLGWDLSQSTLLARNLPNGRVLQITSSTARITDLESGMTDSEWSPEDGAPITAADANNAQALLSVGGTQVIVLDLLDSVRQVAKREDFTNRTTQIACVAIGSPTDNLAVVGFWQGSAVRILSLKDMSVLQTIESDDETPVPRSLLLTTLFKGGGPTLFVGLADGTVSTFSVDPTSFALSGRKDTRLGTQQATFKAIPRQDGTYSVFATCEHSSLIHGSEGRIVFSAITAESATSVCSFNSEPYAGEDGRPAVAIATAEDLKIAMVDTERTTHVQTLAVNETVRRIAYSPALKAFGLGCIQRTLVAGDEIVTSYFRLVDEVMFRELDIYQLNEDELVESVIRCPLDDGSGELAERFVVGTCSLDDGGSDAVTGRIIVFEVTEDRKLKHLTEFRVKGACRCLGIVDGKIVAGLIKTIAIYAFTYTSPSTPHLNKLCSYRTATAPIDICVSGHTIAVADLMKSVSLVEYGYDSERGKHILTEVARHHSTAWGTAVAEVESNTYLESDDMGNLIVLKRDIEGATEEDKKMLHITSELNLGEMVNRIRKVDIVPTEEALVVPAAFLATVEGSLYLFGTIASAYQNTLMQFQQALAEMVESPGHMPFEKYRAFRNPVRQEEEPKRFVDGELLERWQDCSSEVKAEVIKKVSGIGEGDEAIECLTGIVERLRRLH